MRVLAAVLSVALVTAGCYDPRVGGQPTDGSIWDAPAAPDAPSIDAAPVTLLFGECACASLQGVTSDTSLLSDMPTQNYGSDALMNLDSQPIQRGVIRFDVSTIPVGAAIVDAWLHLSNAQNSVLEDGDVAIYALSEAWLEEEATYDARMLGVPWASPGAGDGSHAPDVIASFFPGTPVRTEYRVALPAAIVQAWVDDPDANYGLVLVCTSPGGNGLGLLSSEGDQGDEFRPLLELTYIAP